MSRNKFGFGPPETKADEAASALRRRAPGPMGAAVREAAESFGTATEAKIEARRRNAEDACRWREADGAGLVLVRIGLDEIRDDDLPRDRLELEAVAASDEMEELKTSIRARGQREPIEVYPVRGGYALRKGWRRWTALRQLHAETGDARFATVVARVAPGQGERIDDYIDMVEENVVRENLTFAEMAQLAITAAADPRAPDADADAMVGRLYASLHKMKRSYIRAFVVLLDALGPDLPFPRALARNLGVEAARAIRSGSGDVEALRRALAGAADEEAQRVILTAFVARSQGTAAPSAPAARRPSAKVEFRVGDAKLTARSGECRIVTGRDYTAVPREDLERALKAFEAALVPSRPRIRPL